MSGRYNIPYTFCEQIGKEIRDISDEIPFDIPESWEWVRLGNICNVARGSSPRPIKQYLTEELNGINWIKIGDSDKGGKYINNTKEKIIPEGVSKSRFVHAGDFLLTNSMSFGRPYILNIDGCIHDGWLVLSDYQTAYDKGFLFYMLSSNFAYYQFCDVVSGAVVKNLNSDKVSDVLFPLPPIAEQHRIVTKTEELLPYIAKYEQAENQLTKLNNDFPELLKKSILQEAVQGKLVPQDPNDEPASVLLERIRAEKQTLIKASKIKKDKHESVIVTRDKIPYEIVDGKERCIADEVPFEIPESWEWVRLKDIGIYKKGPFGSSLTKSMFVSKGNDTIKVYEQKNAIKKDHTLGNYYITREYYEEKMQGFTVNPRDIIVSCAGTIGETYVMPHNIELGIINQALMKMTIFAPIDIDYFLMYFDYILKALAKEHSKGSAIKNIPPFDIFKNLLLPLPPIEEQHRIVAKIEELMKYCEML